MLLTWDRRKDAAGLNVFCDISEMIYKSIYSQCIIKKKNHHNTHRKTHLKEVRVRFLSLISFSA